MEQCEHEAEFRSNDDKPHRVQCTDDPSAHPAHPAPLDTSQTVLCHHGYVAALGGMQEWHTPLPDLAVPDEPQQPAEGATAGALGLDIGKAAEGVAQWLDMGLTIVGGAANVREAARSHGFSDETAEQIAMGWYARALGFGG